MILIAVSGSTHTEWVFVEGGQIVERQRTEGVNPYFQTRKEISHIIRLGLPETCFRRKLQKIYFYGAGCSNDARKKTVASSLISQFKTPVVVESDLLAAARGMCVDTAGIACILDTGSNSCMYNGSKITKNVNPCGFILGDEGSGSAIGKAFLSDVLKNVAPQELISAFFFKTDTTTEEVMNSVYDAPLPHYYLSSVAFFLADYIHTEYVRELIYSSFRSFISRNLMRYDFNQNPVCFTGSIALTYAPLLKDVCKEFGFTPEKIEEDVISGLLSYHTKHVE